MCRAEIRLYRGAQVSFFHGFDVPSMWCGGKVGLYLWHVPILVTALIFGCYTVNHGVDFKHALNVLSVLTVTLTGSKPSSTLYRILMLVLCQIQYLTGANCASFCSAGTRP